MNIQIKKYLDPIKNFWVNLTKKKKTILLSVLGAIVLISVIAGIVLNTQPFVVLYPGLDHGEAVEVMNALKERNVDFKEDNGTIYVPKDKENSVRMDLSNQGHPKTAPNYDFFTDNIDMMSTDFEKKTIEKYQLNQRLQSVIETLDCIQDANVTISIPDGNEYVWDENSVSPSASVTVKIADGKSLEPSQVNGIKQLVAKSVPNLKNEDVAVIDTATGNELDSAENKNQINISQFKMEIEKDYEKDIEKKVLKVLTPIFGNGNVSVTAKSVMDVDKKVQEIITYSPSTNDNKGVISESNVKNEQEKNGKGSGGAAGAETNSDVSEYPGITVDGDTIYSKDEQSYKYLVSQVKEQVQGDAANVKDMTISVVINKEAMGVEQKDEIAKLTANAAAIKPDKVAIYSGKFPTEVQPASAEPKGLPLNTIIILSAAALLTLLLVIIISVILRKKKKKKLAKLMEEDELNNPEAENETVSEEDRKIQLQAIEDARAEKASKEDALTQEIKEFTSQNPEIAAQLIRTWLRGDNNDGQ